jgi:hypothetical protein
MDLNCQDMKPSTEHVSAVGEKSPSGLVDSAQLFLNDTTFTTFTPEEEAALVRKVDWMVMPLMSAVYFLQFIDKNLSKFLLLDKIDRY